MSRHGGDTNIQRGAQAGTDETGSAARTVAVVDPEIDRRILQRTRRVVAKVDAHPLRAAVPIHSSSGASIAK